MRCVGHHRGGGLAPHRADAIASARTASAEGVYRNSTRFTISSAVRTSAVSIAPPMSSPMATSGGANKMPREALPRRAAADDRHLP
jgi:hypothetical protein